MKYIFLHGLGQDSSSWDETIQLMNNKGDILCPNLVDWLNNERICYDTLYKGLEKYCSKFTEPICLCGLSLGGILAMQYSIEHPDKINSLVLIGTQYKMPKMILTLQNYLFYIMPSSMFSKLKCQKSDFISLCKSMIKLDFTDKLKNISCPVLILCGKNDKANKSASLQLHKLLIYGKLKIISNAGHEVNRDNPIKLGYELKYFFDNNQF